MLLAYVRRNCSDSDLSPATAVTHMRVSVRSVHKLTERTEHTFGEWLLDERLHRYVRMFRDPAQVRRKISDRGTSQIDRSGHCMKQGSLSRLMTMVLMLCFGVADELAVGLPGS